MSVSYKHHMNLEPERQAMPPTLCLQSGPDQGERVAGQLTTSTAECATSHQHQHPGVLIASILLDINLLHCLKHCSHCHQDSNGILKISQANIQNKLNFVIIVYLKCLIKAKHSPIQLCSDSSLLCNIKNKKGIFCIMALPYIQYIHTHL